MTWLTRIRNASNVSAPRVIPKNPIKKLILEKTVVRQHFRCQVFVLFSYRFCMQLRQNLDASIVQDVQCAGHLCAKSCAPGEIEGLALRYRKVRTYRCLQVSKTEGTLEIQYFARFRAGVEQR